MSFHLLACVSAHGFGHFAMTAPVLNHIRENVDVKLSIRTTLPAELIHARIDGDVHIIPEVSDFGMVMHSSLDVDLQASAKAYQRFHENWSEKIQNEAELLKAHKADLIIANIPYLTVAAARQASIPCIAYCSLNWADIFQEYFSKDLSDASRYLTQMRDAYNSANEFVCPTPSMEMKGLDNIIRVGPVAKIGNNQQKLLKRQLGVTQEKKLVLITPGGVETPVPVDSWPVHEAVHWITSWDYQTKRDDVTRITELSWAFNDVLASCDAVITKPGYGTVTEAVCNNIPALYVLRGDWAEELFLVNWWQENGIIQEITRDQFFSGNIRDALNALWQQPKKSPVKPTGIEQLSDIAIRYIPSELKKI